MTRPGLSHAPEQRRKGGGQAGDARAPAPASPITIGIPGVTSGVAAQLIGASQAVWQRALTHPFVVDIAAGTLAPRRFRYYLAQDILYLDTLADVLGQAAAKATDLSEATRFAHLVGGASADARALRDSHARAAQLAPAKIDSARMAPVTYAYGSHLRLIAATGTLCELLASILPCYGIYAHLWDAFVHRGASLDGHPYRAWWSMCGAPEYRQDTIWLASTLSHHAAGLPPGDIARLDEIFALSSRYEYMFWDMAWRCEEWPV